MPKTQTEDDKKHGDTLSPLIERTKRRSAAGKRKGADDDDAAQLQDDDDDAAQLQDDDDEDVQNDAPGSDRDVGERD